MALLPLALPPGVLRNGTELQSLGRWRDASLTRWANGVLQPVGGWSERVATTAAAPRAALAWEDLAGDRWLAVGSYNKLVAINAAGTVTDITPPALVAGSLDAGVNTGYGGGFFGLGFFGTVRSNPGEYGEATTWSLDTWGQDLIACSVADGTIYAWDLNTANDAVAVTNAPTNCLGAMVTDERFLVALGAGGNPRNIAWSDREDRTVWTPAATNEAGDLDLQTAGQAMCGLRVPGHTLILTDQDAHRMTYQGPPFVYGIERVGESCGVVSRKAAVAMGGRAYWMGQRGFWQWDGQAVTQLRCDIADDVWGSGPDFRGLNTSQASKCFAVSNAQFGEIWFFYPSAESNECDRYAAYSAPGDHWLTGEIARSAGIDRGVFRRPIFFGTDGMAYDHESGFNYGGATVFAESGPVRLGNGEKVMAVTSLIPDEATQGDVTVSFATRFYPGQTERTYGPYTIRADGPTDVRFSGRQATMTVTGARLADWRWGAPSLEAEGVSGR